MTQIFDGTINVHYGQMYVLTAKGGCEDPLRECFQNQNNGLCGTALPGWIMLLTGLHTGKVAVNIEVFEASPPVTNDWEEVVEAPFAVEAEAEGVWLQDWDGDRICTIPLPPGTYRVRYCARNMDRAHDDDTLYPQPIDFYRLYFWPDELSPDSIIKQKSRTAEYWHNWTLSQNQRQPS
jgi:hypothetical protein